MSGTGERNPGVGSALTDSLLALGGLMVDGPGRTSVIVRGMEGFLADKPSGR